VVWVAVHVMATGVTCSSSYHSHSIDSLLVLNPRSKEEGNLHQPIAITLLSNHR